MAGLSGSSSSEEDSSSEEVSSEEDSALASRGSYTGCKFRKFWWGVRVRVAYTPHASWVSICVEWSEVLAEFFPA